MLLLPTDEEKPSQDQLLERTRRVDELRIIDELFYQTVITGEIPPVKTRKKVFMTMRGGGVWACPSSGRALFNSETHLRDSMFRFFFRNHGLRNGSPMLGNLPPSTVYTEQRRLFDEWFNRGKADGSFRILRRYC